MKAEAIAALSVSGAILALGVVGVAIFWFRHRSLRRHRQEQRASPRATNDNATPESVVDSVPLRPLHLADTMRREIDLEAARASVDMQRNRIMEKGGARIVEQLQAVAPKRSVFNVR